MNIVFLNQGVIIIYPNIILNENITKHIISAERKNQKKSCKYHKVFQNIQSNIRLNSLYIVV